MWVKGGVLDGFFIGMLYRWNCGERQHLEEHEAKEVGASGEDAEELDEMGDIKLPIREAEEYGRDIR